MHQLVNKRLWKNRAADFTKCTHCMPSGFRVQESSNTHLYSLCSLQYLQPWHFPIYSVSQCYLQPLHSCSCIAQIVSFYLILMHNMIHTLHTNTVCLLHLHCAVSVPRQQSATLSYMNFQSSDILSLQIKG